MSSPELTRLTAFAKMIRRKAWTSALLIAYQDSSSYGEACNRFTNDLETVLKTAKPKDRELSASEIFNQVIDQALDGNLKSAEKELSELLHINPEGASHMIAGYGYWLHKSLKKSHPDIEEA